MRITERVSVVTRAIAQANIKTTDVRIAVAKFESIPATPFFARTAVSAANSADSKAKVIQLIQQCRLSECFSNCLTGNNTLLRINTLS